LATTVNRSGSTNDIAGDSVSSSVVHADPGLREIDSSTARQVTACSLVPTVSSAPSSHETASRAKRRGEEVG
jgi:hypothetical protein